MLFYQKTAKISKWGLTKLSKKQGGGHLEWIPLIEAISVGEENVNVEVENFDLPKNAFRKIFLNFHHHDFLGDFLHL